MIWTSVQKVTYKAADEAGDEEDDCGGEEDAVGDDQLVEEGGVGLGSEEANPRKLIALNLEVNCFQGRDFVSLQQYKLSRT